MIYWAYLAFRSFKPFDFPKSTFTLKARTTECVPCLFMAACTQNMAQKFWWSVFPYVHQCKISPHAYSGVAMIISLPCIFKDLFQRLNGFCWLLLMKQFRAVYCMNKSAARFFFPFLQLFLLFSFPQSLPTASTAAAAAAVSEDENIGVSSPLKIFQCSTWVKLHGIAGHFHHNHLFCLLLICFFCLMS